MKGFRPGILYPITDSANPWGLSHVELARHFLNAGIRFFQVRDKLCEDAPLLTQLLEVRGLCDAFGAQFVVNDRVDLALASRADGVHLGQFDLPSEAARELMGEDAIIGISTHDLPQFVKAVSQPVDYIACGPIYSSSTKSGHSPPLGPDFLGQVRPLTRLPIVAIGGITLESAPRVWEAGADSLAVIGELLNAEDIESRIREFQRRHRP